MLSLHSFYVVKQSKVLVCQFIMQILLSSTAFTCHFTAINITVDNSPSKKKQKAKTTCRQIAEFHFPVLMYGK